MAVEAAFWVFGLPVSKPGIDVGRGGMYIHKYLERKLKLQNNPSIF